MAELDIAKTIEQADSSISFDKLKSIFSFSSTDQLKPYVRNFDIRKKSLTT